METLHTTTQFQRVVKGGRTHRAPELTLHWLKRADQAPVRVGLVASKKIGGSVRRNLIRRRMREAVRIQEAKLTGYDIVLVARPGIEALNFHKMAEYVANLWQNEPTAVER